MIVSARADDQEAEEALAALRDQRGLKATSPHWVGACLSLPFRYKQTTMAKGVPSPQAQTHIRSGPPIHSNYKRFMDGKFQAEAGHSKGLPLFPAHHADGRRAFSGMHGVEASK